MCGKRALPLFQDCCVRVLLLSPSNAQRGPIDAGYLVSQPSVMLASHYVSPAMLAVSTVPTLQVSDECANLHSPVQYVSAIQQTY